MGSPRHLNRPRVERVPSPPLATAPPRVKCPTGRPRFATRGSAADHHRARLGGALVEGCAACGGYHHRRRKPGGATP